ncbi:MAG: hydrolase family protein, partial [Sediminibacterium sp.]|nr:hydrolase family protein [Sediminibacterium sp.]
ISCLLLVQSITFSQDKLQMKLFRFGKPGDEKPAVLMPDGKSLDVTAFGEDYDERFFASSGIVRLRKWVEKNKAACPLVPEGSRFASCVARPSKIVAIGLNYQDHVVETKLPLPAEPIIFLKATSALAGPDDTLQIPKNSVKTDYEVELAIIIGQKASNIPEAEALKYVAGYSIINDYSEREWQLERTGGQWDKGKSADGFAPLGPFLVTPDILGDPQQLNISLKVNGIIKQQSNTGKMIFTVARIISEVSKYMTLLPGDVIATGTPSGVGLGQKPQVFLKNGDVVELSIEKIGSQKQHIIAYRQN